MTIAVVGSANVDYVIAVDALALPGETVMGGDLEIFSGGKGANQAVAAHRLGAEVAFIGCVGDDTNADVALRNLSDVDTRFVRRVHRPTGVAFISVAPDGENQIVVSPGANAELSTSQIAEASEVIRAAGIVLAQLEVPIAAISAAASIGGGRFVLNPAPAQSLPIELLENVDILVPNRTELAQLTGFDVATNLDEVVRQASRIPGDVVVTLGADGALIVQGGRAHMVPAPSVEAIDATGAGDSFCAALAVELDAGRELREAVEFAVRVGATTTLRRGAQPSLPTRAQVI